MTTTFANMRAVKARAMKSSTIRKELKDWFVRDQCLPNSERDFGKWLNSLIDGVARGIHEECLISVDNLLEGLKVQVVGDSLALHHAEKAAREGYETDTNCYIEEGVVYASVYLSGEDAEATRKRAEQMAEDFRKSGYAAEAIVDDEEERDYFVNAQIDFNLYVKKGGEKMKHY